MIKKRISLILTCVMLLALLPVFASAAETVYESEPNDWSYEAQRIYHDNNVSGELDSILGSDYIDYYTFTISKSEMVRITAMSSNSDYGFRLDGPNGYITASESEGTYGGMYVEEIEMTLDAGTYYISVVGTSYTDFGYALGLYAPSAVADADGGSGEDGVFEFGKEYTHKWNWENDNENFYLDFTVPEDGYVDINFSTYSNDPSDYLYWTIYDENGNEIWYDYTKDEIKDGKFSMRVGLAAGTYELETDLGFVLFSTSKDVYNAVYSIDFTPAENYQKAPYQSVSDGTKVEMGQWYTGVGLGYWRIVLEEAATVVIHIPEYDEIKKHGICAVYDSANDLAADGPYFTDEGVSYLVAELRKGVNHIKCGSNPQIEYNVMVELHECEYEWTIEREPTCSKVGRGDKYCPVCKDEDTYAEIPMTDHVYGDWYVKTAPTSAAEGVEERKCNHCNAKETRTIEKLPIQFKDVTYGAWYAEPVYWAVEKGVTNGIAEGLFGPDQNCTRAQVVTFLWRAAGSPEPGSSANPFKDVDVNDWYGKAVLWAVEKGITNGMTATEFGTDLTCTRAQVATFLWRSQGEPAPESSANPFKDVDASAWYGEAVLWAVEEGVTNGMGEGTFAPDGTCTRGQIVTFLYRAIA